jgi:hypothetical protein
LPAILGGRRQPSRRLLVLVTTRADPGLASALSRLRHQGATVSVVHVLGGGAAGARAGDAGPVLEAAGARYFPLVVGGDLRVALSAGTSDRVVRLR